MGAAVAGRYGARMSPTPAAVAPGAYDLNAYVTAALFPTEGVAFALGDGSVVFGGAERVRAHEGAVLCTAVHPSGSGVLTGGDDGRLAWSRPSGTQTVAEVPGRWIDALAASPASGLIALAAGREVQVHDIADPRLLHTFRHERAVSDLAFEPKGRRLAAASYGGVQLWYGRIAEQKPVLLKWAGSHIGVAWSPDGRFLISSMQENTLHGWRLADGKDMRMGGYPSKVRSTAFLARVAMLATSGASGAVVWPFAGANGPMGKAASEVGAEEGTLVTRVAAHPAGSRLCAGLDDGRIWIADLRGQDRTFMKGAGPPISALVVSPDGMRLAWGDEEGGAGVAAI